MRFRSIYLAVVALVACMTMPVSATNFNIDISPLSGALNLGSTTYTQDHAVGLAAPNETAQPASPATGNEFGSGISYDDVSNTLSLDFAYGSAFGFVDLTSDWDGGLHIHWPGAVNFPAVNTSAGIIHPLDLLHTASGTRSGRVTGSVILTAVQETYLFDNEYYINIHTSAFGAGEIRGQLVPVPEPSALSITILGLLTLVFLGWRRRRA